MKSREELEPLIMDYISRAKSVLPEDFMTDDYLEQLKGKIESMLEFKIQENPEGDVKILLFEVFKELGAPEEIRIESSDDDMDQSIRRKGFKSAPYLIARIIIALVVVLIAAYILSTNAGWDFSLSVGILLIIVVAEWIGEIWKEKNIASSKS